MLQWRNTGDVAAIPPCLVAGEQLGRSVAVDIGARPPVGVAEDEASVGLLNLPRAAGSGDAPATPARRPASAIQLFSTMLLKGHSIRVPTSVVSIQGCGCGKESPLRLIFFALVAGVLSGQALAADLSVPPPPRAPVAFVLHRRSLLGAASISVATAATLSVRPPLLLAD